VAADEVRENRTSALWKTTGFWTKLYAMPVRSICLSLGLAVSLFSVPLYPQSSSPARDDSPYLLRMQHVTEGEDVCVLLQRNGAYHYERVLPSRAQVYEGLIPDSAIAELQPVINGDELVHLTQDMIPIQLVTYHRDEVDLNLSRGNHWQTLRFVDSDSRKPFRQSLDPLMKWLEKLPGSDHRQLSEDAGKNNCLPPQAERTDLDKRPASETQRSPARPAKSSQSGAPAYLMRIIMDQFGEGQGSRTCVVVYPGGLYHLEKSKQKYYQEGIYQPDNADTALQGKTRADVFEQSLDPGSIASLRGLLDDPALANSQHSSLPVGVRYTDADITLLDIPRDMKVQRLAFSNYFGTDGARTRMNAGGIANRHIDSANDLLNPLRKWLKKNVDSGKATRLKGIAGNNCNPGARQIEESGASTTEVAQSDEPGASNGSGPTQGDEIVAASTTSIPSVPADRSDTTSNALEPAISIRVTTRMVLMDFVATDANGKAVTDLKPEDLSVIEDGTSEKVVLLSPPPENQPKNTVPPRPLPPNIFSNRPLDHQPPGPLVLLMFDGLNTGAIDQAYARQQMLEYLRNLKPDQRVAIFALSGDLVLLQDFSSDPRVLMSALKNYTPGNSVELSRGQPFMISATEAAVIANSHLLENLQRFNQENAVNSTDDRTRLTVAALKAIARSMIGYPGRKNLIWISSAFPFSLDLEGRDNDLSRNYASDIVQAGALLSQAQVAVYTVDARGLIGQTSTQSDLRTDSQLYGANAVQRKAGGVVPTIQTSLQPSFGPDELTHTASTLQSSHLVMESLARQTGGLAFYNGNDLTRAINRGAADGTSYYTLGYYPQNKNWDGKFRRVVIHANRTDLKIRAREGYFAFDASAASAAGNANVQQERSRELQVVLKDPLPDTGVTFRARVLPSATSPSHLQVEFLVDANSISFKEIDQGREESNLDFAAFAVARDGKLFDTVVQNVATPLPAAQYARVHQKGLPFHLDIKSLPDGGTLHLAVRDNRTGLLGTLTVPLPLKDVAVVQSPPDKK